MFSYISEFFSDPLGFIVIFLIALPGRMLAISGHEAAHAYVAYRCGDPTAKNMGRITLNPLKHLDIVGCVMLLVLGFGWAKPVPVNPYNYRKPRRDDILVSLAGITANLIMALIGFVLMYAILGFAIANLKNNTDGASYIFQYAGEMGYVTDGGYYQVLDIVRHATGGTTAGQTVADIIVEPAFGSVVSTIYKMLVYLISVNLGLAVFNLIPMPPLDGYHVLNDIVLKKNLFASRRASEICTLIMILLVVSGVAGKVIGYVTSAAISGVGSLAGTIFTGLGLA